MQTQSSTTYSDSTLNNLKELFAYSQKAREELVFRVYDEQQSNIKNHLWLLSLILTGFIALISEFPMSKTHNLLDFLKVSFAMSTAIGAGCCVAGMTFSLRSMRTSKFYIPASKFIPFYDYLNQKNGTDSPESLFAASLQVWIKETDEGIQQAIKQNELRAKDLLRINTLTYIAGSFFILSSLFFLFFKFS